MSTLGVEYFPSRTSSNFLLKSIFLSLIRASIKKGSQKAKLEKVLQQNKIK